MSESRFPWRTLLFASVALNLVAAGAVAGGYAAGLRFERASPTAVVDRMPGPRAFVAALPAETRAKVREELARSWTQSHALREAAVQARRDAFAAAAAEPYDAARVKAAFERLRVADQAAIGVFHDNIADVFATLSTAERREALHALRDAAPARRQALAPRAEEGAAGEQGIGPARRALTPEQRQERRERWRQRRRADPQTP